MRLNGLSVLKQQCTLPLFCLRLLTFLLILVSSNLAFAALSNSYYGISRTLSTGGTISSPHGIAVTAQGTVYIADSGNSRIIQVLRNGTASVLNITGLSTPLLVPRGLAITDAGVLYIADYGNGRIVSVDPTGAATVLDMAGLTLSGPSSVAVAPNGTIYVSDTGNNRLIRILSGGSAAVYTPTGAATTFSGPTGLAVDTSGNLYVADTGADRIVQVTPGGSGSVVAAGATLNNPQGVALDSYGNLYIADTNSGTIYQVSASGTTTNYLAASNASVSAPVALALNPMGALYVTDTTTNTAKYIDQNAADFGHVTYNGGSSTLSLPFAMGSGVLSSIQIVTNGTQNQDFQAAASSCSVGATNTSCVLSISFSPTAPGLRTGSVIVTYQVSGTPNSFTIPLFGFADSNLATLSPGTSSVVSTGTTSILRPFQIARDYVGNLYVSSYNDSQIYKIPAGGGQATVVSVNNGITLNNPTGIAIDGSGNLMVSDYSNGRLVQISAAGNASVFSISGISLSFPTALTYDAAGNLYVMDYGHGRVVKVAPNGVGKVVATGSYTFPALTTIGVAVDPDGNLYIAQRDGTSQVIKVTPSGNTSAVPMPNNVSLNGPQGVSTDALGNLYIVDSGNSRIIQVKKSGAVSAMQFSGSAFSSLTFNAMVAPDGNIYVADWSNDRILLLNTTQATQSFATTVQFQTSSDSPKTTAITNLGNLPLNFSANTAFTADFTEDTGDTNPCTSTTTLSPGASCDVSVKFTPQSAGTLSASITVTNDNLNQLNSTQSVAVSGVATRAGDTTNTAVTISPSTLINGQTATIAATVTDTDTGQSSTIPTGSVTFTDQVGSTITTLNNNAAVTLVNGVATLSNIQLTGIGAHTITATYAGISGSFRASSNSATASLDKASVTIASASPSPLIIVHGQAGTEAVTVTGPYSTLTEPTGSLTYTILNSSNTIVNTGSATLSAGTGNATASITIPNTLTTGSYTLTLNFSGDSNYAASTTATSFSFNIEQLTPVIAFAQPSAIPYGTNLSSVLSATATYGTNPVPGTVVYTTGNTTLQASTVLAAGTYPITATFTPTDSVTYAAATANVSLVVNKVEANVASSANAVTLTTGQSGAITITAAAPTQTLATPTGVLTYTLAKAGGASTTGVVSLVPGSGASTGTISLPNTLSAGTYSATILYGGDTNYVATTAANPATVTVTIIPINTMLTWAPPTSINYGTNLSTFLTATASNGTTTIPGTSVYTTGGITLQPTMVLTVGTYPVTVTFTPTDTINYTAQTATKTLVVNKAIASINLTSSANPTLITTAVSFTATVTASGSPATGTVVFYDGTSALGTVALSNGTAIYTTSSLTAATHSIAAVYSGDSNFNTITSTPIAQLIQDFSINAPSTGGTTNSPSGAGGPSQPALPGALVSYTFSLGPINGSVLPTPITLSVSGVPQGGSATLTPTVIPAGSPLSNVTLTVQLPKNLAADTNGLSPLRRMTPIALGILLLPFAARFRRTTRKLSGITWTLLLLFLGACATVGISGCGTNSGYFASQPKNYTLTITATSGSVSRQSNVTIYVQ